MYSNCRTISLNHVVPEKINRYIFIKRRLTRSRITIKNLVLDQCFSTCGQWRN